MLDESATRTIRVVLADDHDILRQGLKMLLSLQPEVQVVGEARTGREALDLALALRPDVVVLDITMPDMDGLAACQLIRQQVPTTQVLILTMHESDDYFLEALRLGAAGYLVKKAAPGELHLAIQAVAQGGAYLYPGLAKVLIRQVVPEQTAGTAPKAALGEQEPPGKQTTGEWRILTQRELEVLKLVAEGYTNQQIADQLAISIKTVQAHRANVMEKLGLQGITHLVRFAIRTGLLPEP